MFIFKISVKSIRGLWILR